MKVIIPVWARVSELMDLTRASIDSIRQAKDTQIILVDNGSPMGGAQLKEWADLYIHNKENLGYAKAVNQGLRMCDAEEIVCISNNDIRVPGNWADVALDILKDKTVGSVHYRMIPYDQPFNPGTDTWTKGKERWCTSSFFVVRNIQYYDENYLNSYDDWDYWKRVRATGYTQAYTNRAEYQHRDSFTQQFVPQRGENDTRNREYFKKKWGMYPEEDFEKNFPGDLAKAWRPQP